MLFQLFGVFVIWILAPLIMCSVSLVYFLVDDKSGPFQTCLLSSMHGFLGSLVFLVAFVIAFIGSPSPGLREPYLLLWLAPVVLIGVSLWRFNGPGRTHLLLVPLLGAMCWGVVVSYTLVGGGK